MSTGTGPASIKGMEHRFSGPEAGSALWDFAVRLYAEPGVGEACLTLQDRCGVDVPLLLWAAWLGGGADMATLRTGDRAVGPWRARAVRPLRALRRHLRQPVSGLDDKAREDWRGGAKRLELEAERLALSLLAGIGRRGGRADLATFAVAFGLDCGCPELALVEAAARRLA